jgi:thymidylate kinase
MTEDIQFIEGFFIELEKRNISFCILRNADEVEQGDAHDVDMTVDDDSLQEAERTLLSVAKSMGWKLHIKTGAAKDRYNIKCYHLFKIVSDETGADIIRIVHFDIFPTFTWNGYVMLDNDVLIHGIDGSNIYHRADPTVEAVTKLFIRLLHNGYIKTKYKEYIKTVFESNEDHVCIVLQKFMSSSMVDYIIETVKKEKWCELEENRNKIVADLKKHSKNNQIGQKKYLVQKAVSKAGIMVAFEGTDGSGKSTIIKGLPLILGNSFPDDMQDYYHWRPCFIKKEKRTEDGHAIVVTEPHAKKPYGKVKSLAKFMFFNLDYILGYWCKVRWQISKGHLVIFDRYYYDYYMDKIRYRLSIGNGVLSFFGHFIPKPDITFLLVGDAQVLYERKKEIAVEEIQEQMDKLMNNQKCFNNPKVIDVNQPVDKVMLEVSKEILNSCSKKY